jgi:hypothetical protein
MRQNYNSAMGALSPILFFTFVYGVSLFMAFFVCRTVYFSLSTKDEISKTKVVQDNSKSTMLAAQWHN